jgi:Flp pilus assembly protein TadB
MKLIVGGVLGMVLAIVGLFVAAEVDYRVKKEIEKQSHQIAVGRTPKTGYPATHKAFRKDLPVSKTTGLSPGYTKEPAPGSVYWVEPIHERLFLLGLLPRLVQFVIMSVVICMILSVIGLSLTLINIMIVVVLVSITLFVTHHLSMI